MLTVTISRRVALLLAVVLMLLVPAVAYAGSVFEDVDDDAVHIDGITFMKDSGVSVGCDANNNYCPDDNVTRAQMATFMYRLSGNDPATDPSVNAATLDGFTAEDLMGSGGGGGDGLPSAEGKHAYAFACVDDEDAAYNPVSECGFSYSSNGGAISVDRTTVGQYVVTFTGLAAPASSTSVGTPRSRRTVRVRRSVRSPRSTPSPTWR